MTVQAIRQNIRTIQEDKRDEPLRASIDRLKTEVKKWCAISLVRNQNRLDEILGNKKEQTTQDPGKD